EAISKYYSSSLMKQLTDGRFNPAVFNADEFISRFVDTASVKDLRQVMIQLRASDPELPNLIKRRAMAELLEKASGKMSPESVVSGAVGDFSYEKLASSLAGSSGEKYRTLLGKESLETLKDLM